MIQSVRWWSLAAAAALLVAVSCTGGRSTGTGPHPAGLPMGGTLRLSMPKDFRQGGDPQREDDPAAWELFRCCLLRTLMSYRPGAPDAPGRVFPDLAEGAPTVSADGLTWTFTLKRDLHYAPPLDNVPIVAQDIVRALRREARLDSPTSVYFSVIKGFDDYGSGASSSIQGLEPSDPHTLKVNLTEPAGDLPFRFALPATAPIPPNPDHSNDTLGVAEGHDAGDGRFVVASGPYMYEGSPQLDFSPRPDQQQPVAGYVPGLSISLVRNPAWVRSSDDLRGAFVDRIEILIGGSPSASALKVQDGSLDLQFGRDLVPAAQIREDVNTPTYHDAVPLGLRYIAMNVAVPPFDDVAVRKAVSYAIDKRKLIFLVAHARRSRLAPQSLTPAKHLLPDGVEANLLVSDDPYQTPHHAGSLRDARRAMQGSLRYDTNHDGRCDADACRHVLLPVPAIPRSPWEAVGRQIQGDMAGIGIHVDLEPLAPYVYERETAMPGKKFALVEDAEWAAAYPSASTYFLPLLDGAGLTTTTSGNRDLSLVGATADELSMWGYPAGTVQPPTIDPFVTDCLSFTGDDQVGCWAMLDRYVMRMVVPWVPYLAYRPVTVTSRRVMNFHFDPFTRIAALDQLALRPAPEAVAT